MPFGTQVLCIFYEPKTKHKRKKNSLNGVDKFELKLNFMKYFMTII